MILRLPLLLASAIPGPSKVFFIYQLFPRIERYLMARSMTYASCRDIMILGGLNMIDEIVSCTASTGPQSSRESSKLTFVYPCTSSLIRTAILLFNTVKYTQQARRVLKLPIAAESWTKHEVHGGSSQQPIQGPF